MIDECYGFLEQNLARFLEWIRAADSKISPILAIDTLMLTILVALIPIPIMMNLFESIISLLAVIPLLVSLIFLALATFPQTKGPSDSLIYFNCVAKINPDAYLKEILSADKQRLLLELARQCCRNAEIASQKYRYLKIALGALFASILPWLIIVFILCRRQ